MSWGPFVLISVSIAAALYCGIRLRRANRALIEMECLIIERLSNPEAIFCCPKCGKVYSSRVSESTNCCSGLISLHREDNGRISPRWDPLQ